MLVCETLWRIWLVPPLRDPPSTCTSDVKWNCPICTGPWKQTITILPKKLYRMSKMGTIFKSSLNSFLIKLKLQQTYGLHLGFIPPGIRSCQRLWAGHSWWAIWKEWLWHRIAERFTLDGRSHFSDFRFSWKWVLQPFT